MTMPCTPWEVDPAALGVCSDWSAYPASVKTSALKLASFWLWAATGRRFGPCPVTVRPVRGRRWESLPQYRDYPVTPGLSGLNQPGGPFLFAGRWFNDGCGGSACCGTRACAVVLQGPVYAVNEVTIGDEVVPASAYRVDVANGTHLLVRIDGECWPICQDFTAEPGEAGSFVISYEIGEQIPGVLAVAAAVLACEYGKFFSGGKCALPAKMTRLSRQGVEVEVAPPDPVAGTSGIKIVDDVVAMLNPSKRKAPPRVMSPDFDNCDRYTTVPAGS